MLQEFGDIPVQMELVHNHLVHLELSEDLQPLQELHGHVHEGVLQGLDAHRETLSPHRSKNTRRRERRLLLNENVKANFLHEFFNWCQGALNFALFCTRGLPQSAMSAN